MRGSSRSWSRRYVREPIRIRIGTRPTTRPGQVGMASNGRRRKAPRRRRKRRNLGPVHLRRRLLIRLRQLRQLLYRLLVVRRQLRVSGTADSLRVRVVVVPVRRREGFGRRRVVLRGVGLHLDHRLRRLRHPPAARRAVLAQQQRRVARAVDPVLEGVRGLALPAVDPVLLQAVADLPDRGRRLRQPRRPRLDRLRVERRQHREELFVRVALEVRRRHQIVPPACDPCDPASACWRAKGSRDRT